MPASERISYPRLRRETADPNESWELSLVDFPFWFESLSFRSYFERAPVALSRLEYLDDGRVLYRGNFHPSLRRDYQLVSGVEFLAMLVAHIALRFECRIYSYGALSTTIPRTFGWIQKDRQEAKSPEVVVSEEEGEVVKLRRGSGECQGSCRPSVNIIRSVACVPRLDSGSPP